MLLALLAALAVAGLLTAILVATLREGPPPPSVPRVTVRRGGFAALAAGGAPPVAERIDAALEGLAPERLAGGAELLTAGMAGWAGLDRIALGGVARLAKAHLLAFWDLSATVDVDRLRVASDGLSSTLSGVAVHLSATPHAGGGHPHELSFQVMTEHSSAPVPAFDPHHALAAAHDPGVHLTHVGAGLHLGAADAAGHVDGPVSVAMHAIPVGTMLVTGYRESKLLLRGDTEPGRAVKNVGLDVAGVAVLAKAGAAVGLVLGPVGAVAGGVVGALTGKLAAGLVKSRPLKKAQKAHEGAWEGYREQERLVHAETERAWEAAHAEEAGRYQRALEAAQARPLRLADDLEVGLLKAAGLGATDAERLLAAGEQRLAALERRLLESLPARRLRPRRERGALRDLRADARAWRREAGRLRSGWAASAEQTEALFDLLLALPGDEEEARAHAARVRAARGAAHATLGDAVRSITDEFARLRAAAVKALTERLNTLKRRMAERLEPYYAAVEKAYDALQLELRRAGRAPAPG